MTIEKTAERLIDSASLSRKEFFINLHFLWSFLYPCRQTNNRLDCEAAIEKYAEGADGGITERCIRQSCGLQDKPQQVPTSVTGDASDSLLPGNPAAEFVPAPFDPVAADMEENKRHCAAIAIAGLNNNTETMTVHQIERCLGAQHKKGETVERLIRQGFLIPARPNRKKTATYIPKISLANPLAHLFPMEPASEVVCPETYTLESLRALVEDCPARLANQVVYQKYLGQLQEGLATGGRMSIESERKWADIDKQIAKIDWRESTLESLLKERTESDESHSDGCKTIHRTYDVHEEGRRSRRYVRPPGAQSLGKVYRTLLIPSVYDMDISKCEFTIGSQQMGRVGVELAHAAAKFSCCKQLMQDAAAALDQVDTADHCGAKLICHSVFNGSALPSHLVANGFLKLLKQEGQLFRWVASQITPDFYKQCLEDLSRTWPEATNAFYLWTGGEDHCVEALTDHIFNEEERVTCLP